MSGRSSMAGGAMSPRSRFSSQTNSNLLGTTITDDDKKAAYNAVRCLVEGIFETKQQKVSPTSLAAVLAKCVDRTMTIAFAFTGVVTLDEQGQLSRNLAHMEPSISVGTGVDKDCELTISVNVQAGLDEANRRIYLKMQQEQELRRQRYQEDTTSRKYWYIVAAVLALAVVIWWVITPSAGKWAMLYRIVGKPPTNHPNTPSSSSPDASSL